MPTQQDQTKAYPPSHGHEGPHEIDTTRARQGESPGRMRYVLAISIGLVAIAFANNNLVKFRIK
jgi:hypothetical protein